MEAAASSANSESYEGSPARVNSIPLFPASRFDLVVIAASAGGIPVVREIIARLPPSFPAPIAVVQHIGAHRSKLADFLDLRSRIAVRFAQDGERLRACTIFVAPPDRHLTICKRRRFSGMGRDGAAGARLVKQRGGVVLVQDPTTAEAASMPSAVIRAGCADLVLGVEALAGALSSIVENRTALALLGLPRRVDRSENPSTNVAA